jgi:hypothetical protein
VREREVSRETLEALRRDFRERFGRDPGPDDPVFFDPTAEEPRPLGEDGEAVFIAMVREKYEGSQLASFLIRRIDLTSPVAVIVEADLTTAGRTNRAALHWIHETSTGDMTLPNRPGQWRLLLWGSPA